jgi:hypothetical protein
MLSLTRAIGAFCPVREVGATGGLQPTADTTDPEAAPAPMIHHNSLNRHPHGEVLVLDVGRADMPCVGIAGAAKRL